jgi:hypothetical protein
MSCVQIFEIDRSLLGECMKDALEKGRVLIAMHPMLVGVWLYFFEVKSRVRMKSKPVPLISWYY